MVLGMEIRFMFLVPPTLHLIRHAQATHNLTPTASTLLDPPLTPNGRSQCQLLASTFPHHSRINLIVSSPLRRTLETALLAFQSHLTKEKGNGMKVVALPELQETSDLPCDTGSDVEVLRGVFGDGDVDFGLVEGGWDSKMGKWAATSEAIDGRAREARRWLRDRLMDGEGKGDVVVVTHGGFLHFLTEDWTNSRRFQGTGWLNCEYRSYTFNDSTDPNASMTETEESRARRRGTEKPFTEAERIQLRETALRTWDNAGGGQVPVESKV